MPVLKPKALLANRVEAVRSYHAKSGIKRAELDVSGGIDSAVMAGVLVLALGAENVTFAHLGINSNPVQTERAKRLIDGIGAKLAVGDFTQVYALIFSKVLEDLEDAGYDLAEIKDRIAKDPTILGSIRSTLRAPLGRAFNRLTGGGIRHGTGNECEDRFLRFYQKGGDGEVDTNPVAMLSKAEIYQLAYALADCFPEAKAAYYETIGAVPSADLWGVGDVHTDETEIKSWLGADFTYGRLDPDTGKVVNVGTIERVARFLDEVKLSDSLATLLKGEPINGYLLFGEDEPDWVTLATKAVDSQAFKDMHFKSLLEGLAYTTPLLRGARKAERCTRHKWNPNCPALGTRKELLDAGILSDNFADYGI